MANKANAFISGFTGGMGAMTNMINARDQREYNAQKMEWAKEDRAYQAQERDYQLQEREKAEQKQQYQNNFGQLSSIRSSLGNDPEKIGQYDQAMFDYMNKQFKPLLDQQMGENSSFVAFKLTEGGYVPRMKFTNKEGKEVVDYLKDKNGQPMAISTDNFMQIVGSVPGLVDRAELTKANLLGKGISPPEQGETFTPSTVDGMRVNTSSKTGKESLVGYAGKGGGSGSGSGSGGSGGDPYKTLQTWEGENGTKTTLTRVNGRYLINEHRGSSVITKPASKEWLKQNGFLEESESNGGGGGSVADRVKGSSGIKTPEDETTEVPKPEGGAAEEGAGKPDKSEKGELGEIADALFTPSPTGQKMIGGAKDWWTDYQNLRKSNQANPPSKNSNFGDIMSRMTTISPTGKKMIGGVKNWVSGDQQSAQPQSAQPPPQAAGMAAPSEGAMSEEKKQTILTQIKQLGEQYGEEAVIKYLSRLDPSIVQQIQKELSPEA